MRKRIWALTLALLMCSSVAWADWSEQGQRLAQVKDEGLVDMDKTIEFTYWGFNVSGYLPTDDAEIKQVLEQRFNVKINNVLMDDYNTEQVNVMLAAGLEFDFCGQGRNIQKQYETGLIRALPEELLATYAPFIYQSLEDEVGPSWRLYGSVDGTLYGIPVIASLSMTRHITVVRTDWMQAVGYDEPPTTLTGLEEMLLKFVTDDPDGNGADDTYALGRFDDLHAYVLGAYGIGSRYWYSDAEGYPANYAIDPRYKEALHVLARWYSLGIFDPEIILDGRNETTAKVINNKLGGYLGTDWCWILGHAISPRQIAANQGIDLELTVIPPVEGPYGDRMTTAYSAPISTNSMVFGLNCSEEKMIRILQMMNVIHSDEELCKYVMWGPKDILYVEAGDGYVDTTPEYTNENMHMYGAQRYMMWSFKPESTFKWQVFKNRAESFGMSLEYPVVDRNLADLFKTDAENEYGAAASKVAEEFYWKAFTGEIDIDAQWDAYVDTWLKAGGAEIIAQKRAMYESLLEQMAALE